MKSLDHLKKLTAIASPSGYENAIIAHMSKKFNMYADNLEIDNMGNLIIHVTGESSRKLMLTAHADEIGLLISYIDAAGFIYVQPIGSIDINLLPGLQVRINTSKGAVPGIIGKQAIHLEQEPTALSYDTLCIDIGASSRSEALQYVEIGDTVSFVPIFLELPNRRICSNGLDNKLHLALLIDLLEKIKDHTLAYDLYIVLSTQEELGFRGISAAVRKVEPDECIVLDMSHATDYADISIRKYGDIQLGQGFTINTGPNVDKNLSDRVKNIAKREGIPYQIVPYSYPTGSDANAVQICNFGIKTLLMGVPCRYMHSNVETASLDDYDSLLEVIYKFCLK